MPRTQRRRTALRAGVAVAVIAIVAGGLFAIVVAMTRPGPPRPECKVAAGKVTYRLDLEQAANASTIAAVGKREGLPDHAVTVALAASLQESNLRNLGYGDRDSVGLFQQRPSQGWGAREELMIPSFAAAAFYRELTKVSDWESLPVNDAAQKVQRSGAPSAYAKWEGMARDLAVALTGEQPAGIACTFRSGQLTTSPETYLNGLSRDLGVRSLDANLTPAQAWTAAAWLVTHAQEYGITSVSFDGQEWQAHSGRWQPAADAGSTLHVVQTSAHP